MNKTLHIFRSPQGARSRSNGHQRDDWRRGASPVQDRRGGGRIDYDTPRDETLEEDLLRRRVASKTTEYDDNYTMASRREQVNTVSPLQGTFTNIYSFQEHKKIKKITNSLREFFY